MQAALFFSLGFFFFFFFLFSLIFGACEMKNDLAQYR